MQSPIQHIKRALIVILCGWATLSVCKAQSFRQQCSNGIVLSYVIQQDITTVAVYCEEVPDSVTEVVIPATVTYNRKNYTITAIKSKGFKSFSKITTVTLPSTIIAIGAEAFYECEKLSSVCCANAIRVPNTVCIPSSVSYVGKEAFAKCSNLNFIIVDKGNPTYDSRNNCNAIIETKTNTLLCGCQSTLIPNNVTSIGPLAFHGCSGLTSITIPESVTFIGYGAFQKCEKLTSVHIPKSVTTIETGILNYCESVTAITVDTANPAYDSRDNCNAIIATKTNTLVCGCQNTIIPNTVTAIGFNAFFGCSGLTSITIPESVTSIKAFAFDNCKNLPTVHIPKSVTSIGPRVFMWDIRDKITIDPDNPVYGSNYNGGKSKPLD